MTTTKIFQEFFKQKMKFLFYSPVILISADGFRSDYLTLGLTPYISAFGRCMHLLYIVTYTSRYILQRL